MAKFSIEYPLEVSSFIYDDSLAQEAFAEVELVGPDAVKDALEDVGIPLDSDDISLKIKLSSFTDEDPSIALAIFKLTFTSSDEELLQELQEQLEEEGYEAI